MEQLIYFVTGILFIEIIYPVLDSVANYIMNFFGKKSVELQVDAERYKNIFENEVNQTQETGNMNAIGFDYISEEDDDEE